jgi:hypothetical protein
LDVTDLFEWSVIFGTWLFTSLFFALRNLKYLLPLLLLAPGLSAQTISVQPGSVIVGVGQTATFSIVVSDPTCSILWQRNGINLTSSGPSFTTAPTLITDNGAKYTAVVYNCKVAAPAHSGVAVLTVTALAPINLTISGKLAFEDSSPVYTGPIVIEQWNVEAAPVSSTWVPAGNAAIDATGLLSGLFVINPSLVDSSGNVQFRFTIPGAAGAAPLAQELETLKLIQFQQGSSGIVVNEIVFKAPFMSSLQIVSKSSSVSLTP